MGIQATDLMVVRRPSDSANVHRKVKAVELAKIKNGKFIANHTIVDAGTYTMDCVGGARSFTLPPATGSQREFTLCFVNVTRTKTASINFAGGDRINGIDSNLLTVVNRSYTFIDADVNRYTCDTVIETKNSLSFHVPSQFPTIQEALNATLMFKSETGVLWVFLANGTYHQTTRLYCNHMNNVRVRGGSGQYYPRQNDGSDSVLSSVKATDLAYCEGLGGTILKVNAGSNGLSMAYARNVSFCYMQIHDNSPSPANYLIQWNKPHSCETLYCDRVLFFGSKYGIILHNAINLQLSFCTYLHQSVMAVRLYRCLYAYLYNNATYYSRYGVTAYDSKLINLSRFQVWSPTNASATYGAYLVNCTATLTYPWLTVKNSAVYAIGGSYVNINLTTNPAPVNETKITGAWALRGSDSHIAMTTNSACNVTWTAISNGLVHLHQSTITVASSMTLANGVQPANRLYASRNSVGRNALNTNALAQPPVGTAGSKLEQWID